MSDYDSIESLQEQGILDSKKVAVIKGCLIMFFHCSIFAVLASQIFAIWLDKQMHLNSLQIGELLGMKTLVAVFYKPLFGWLLDKTQLRIRFIITIAIGGLGAGPFFQFVYKPLLESHTTTGFFLAGLLGGVYFGYVIIAAGGVVWTYTGRYIEAHGGTVDKLAASNSTAWLLMSFILTMLYTINPIWGFYLASLSALGMFITLLTLKVKAFDSLNTKSTSKQKIQLADLKKLVSNPRFYVLVFFAITTMVVVFAQYGQIGRYSLSFWPKNMQTYGLKFDAYLTLPLRIIQIFILAVCSKIIKKFNPSRTLMLVGVGYGLSFLAFGCAALLKDYNPGGSYMPSLVASIIAKQMLLFVHPFFNVVVLSYVFASFDKVMAGTALLVGFHFVSNLGASLGNGVIGEMLKTQGWGRSYVELAIYIFVATIILGLLIKFANYKDKVRVLSHLKSKVSGETEA